MGAATRKNTFKIVRHVNLDEETLKKIAEALGIPEAERDRIISISGEIEIGPAPIPPSGGSPTTSSGGGSPTAPAGSGSPPTPSHGSPPSTPSAGSGPPTPSGGSRSG
jgi:hypothetical protein